MPENPPARILVADDERSIRWVLGEALRADGHEVIEATGGEEALAALARGDVDLAFLDIRMPEPSGLDVVTRAKAEGCRTTIVVMTAQATMSNAVEAMKRGAYDYLTKPFDLEVVRLLVARALETRRLNSDVDHLTRELRRRSEGDVDLVGQSPAMQSIYKLLGRVAKSDATVLVTGESGTGKELIARSIHLHSPRWQGPFVAINCSAIPRELLESELFGYERGAFTGATERRAGRFEQAAGGTIFLDEIGTMSPALQAKLLRVLQEREFEPLGSERTEKIDVRVIAATNRDLRQMVAEGKFQEDLFYRLNVIPIELPALRERRDDIPALAEHFVRKHSQRTGRRIDAVADGVIQGLQQYEWPGNVRELENTIERAVVLTPGAVITEESISVLGATTQQATGLPSLRLRNNIEWVEKETIRRALESSKGVKKDAAELMGISQRALSYYLAKYRID